MVYYWDWLWLADWSDAFPGIGMAYVVLASLLLRAACAIFNRLVVANGDPVPGPTILQGDRPIETSEVPIPSVGRALALSALMFVLCWCILLSGVNEYGVRIRGDARWPGQRKTTAELFLLHVALATLVVAQGLPTTFRRAVCVVAIHVVLLIAALWLVHSGIHYLLG